MVLGGNSTVFDFLAILCALLTKEEERLYAIKWMTADEKHLQKIIYTYRNLLAVILNASVEEYRLDNKSISYLNEELERLQNGKDNNKEHIFRLAVEVEKRLDMYSAGPNRGVIYRLEPLNANVKETQIAIYPRIMPRWNTKKSERNRERRLNANFMNYMMIRMEDAAPFEMIMHYWNDEGILQKTEGGWKLKVGLTPVMDSAKLKSKELDLPSGYAVGVEGIDNEEEVTERVLRVFNQMFSEEYGIIVFPEALGTEEALLKIKRRMRENPEYCTFVAAPTICNDGRNILVVLGPGGIECLRQEKTAPAILTTKEGKVEREDLCYGNQVHLLITKELGLMAFAICAELLDPDYYRLIVNTALADTIICSSFSPGIAAFRDTLLKGAPANLLELYINTCSARFVSRKNEIALPIGFVQIPFSDGEEQPYEVERKCHGQCAQEVCYFDIAIMYQNQKFHVEIVHKRCA